MSRYIKFDPNNPPPPLMTGEPDSFAYRTMTTRIPANLENVIADHKGKYPPAIVRALEALREEIVAGDPIRPLETTAPDQETWTKAWQAHRGRSWLDVPWYFAEVFFYRRLLEAVNYFGDSPELRRHASLSAQNHQAEKQADWKPIEAWVGVDPFLPQKEEELQSEAPWRVLTMALDQAANNSVDSLRALLHHCVWGNRIDLSYTQVAETSGREASLEQEQANLLVDDTEPVAAHLRPLIKGGQSAGMARIDFICDNAGTELLLDLALADLLLGFQGIGHITLHLKAHPTFVSDAIPADVTASFEAIRGQATPEMEALANRLEKQQATGRLRLLPHLFWNSHHFFWELPPDLHQELAQAQLVIIKGDANYRRLLGDSRWPTTVPVSDAIPYFPAPFVALRTMKSDPVVGLKTGQAKALDREDPEWRVNGKRGMIQSVI